MIGLNLKPTKECFDVVKEFGTKWVVGLASMNAGVLMYILTNYMNNPNILIHLSIMALCIGTISTFVIGWNVFEFFLRYHIIDSNEVYYCRKINESEFIVRKTKSVIMNVEENKDIRLYNSRIKILHAFSLLGLVIGGILFLLNEIMLKQSVVTIFFVIAILLIYIFNGFNEIRVKKDSGLIPKVILAICIIAEIVLIGILILEFKTCNILTIYDLKYNYNVMLCNM